MHTICSSARRLPGTFAGIALHVASTEYAQHHAHVKNIIELLGGASLAIDRHAQEFVINHLQSTCNTSLALLVLCTKSMCTLYNKKLTLKIYHSFVENASVAKFDFALLNAQGGYAGYLVQRTCLGKRKRCIWTATEQEELDFVMAGHTQLTAREL